MVFFIRRVERGSEVKAAFSSSAAELHNSAQTIDRNRGLCLVLSLIVEEGATRSLSNLTRWPSPKPRRKHKRCQTVRFSLTMFSVEADSDFMDGRSSSHRSLSDIADWPFTKPPSNSGQTSLLSTPSTCCTRQSSATYWGAQALTK